MPSTYYLSLLAGLASVAVAQDPFYMCTDNKCEDCPSSIASSGTGFPNCVIYNSQDVFAQQGYEGTDGGGYTVYFDVQKHEPGCATIIKTPAGTDLEGCGATIGAFKQPACATLALEKTFMVQSCCGTDCDSAGRKMIRGIGPMGTVRSVSIDGRGGLLLKDGNGTVIEPAEVGPPPEVVAAQKSKRSGKSVKARHVLHKRGCKKNSWQGGEVLTKPADNVQIVKDAVSGGTEGASISVTAERSQTYTTSMSLGFSDILSLGVSAEMSETVSSGSTVQVDIPGGQSGKLGFTATLSCSTGKGECNDGEVEGEVCWPTKGPDGDVRGTYRVIVES
ncbi:hypothetical protein N0V90_008853 [Kalmusia sp. IMI 367209]|nr:hypothetical protein N0V90_008853 [Kalmusia sp. IMI 367209]